MHPCLTEQSSQVNSESALNHTATGATLLSIGFLSGNLLLHTSSSLSLKASVSCICEDSFSTCSNCSFKSRTLKKATIDVQSVTFISKQIFRVITVTITYTDTQLLSLTIILFKVKINIHLISCMGIVLLYTENCNE